MAYKDNDDDSSRLPEGFQRIGYDADTQVTTFKSPEGELYESAPGNRYGQLWPAGQRPQHSQVDIEANNQAIEQGNFESARMMLPFALIIIVFLVVLLRTI
ncbi:uncharacterized protein M421DRAFT_425227 [Didymella exigua CBS 183.55]|uniref:Carbohydrate-binding module family 50 protein n=1 Tax=Didymella exigua CBS 183.55 TaxID=1150837 RepID=A0A6A5R8J0_9PLEO|nr:uncharacterized protein M421DRAFT_425227 [Didymella exigua CBS 183.55]KAF1924042.1 hypothetical protein M421DRAFT_425227 [Didymella exigua CBS 183.55]